MLLHGGSFKKKKIMVGRLENRWALLFWRLGLESAVISTLLSSCPDWPQVGVLRQSPPECFYPSGIY